MSRTASATAQNANGFFYLVQRKMKKFYIKWKIPMQNVTFLWIKNEDTVQIKARNKSQLISIIYLAWDEIRKQRK